MSLMIAPRIIIQVTLFQYYHITLVTCGVYKMSFEFNIFYRNQDKTPGDYLVVLIHGLGAPETFLTGRPSWKDLLLIDKDLEKVDVAFVQYDTAHFVVPWFFGLKGTFIIPKKNWTVRVGPVAAITTLAKHLKRDLQGRNVSNYQKVILLGHSMGGLIAMRYILETVDRHEPMKVARCISVATPFNGSEYALLTKNVPGNKQILDLSTNSDFSAELSRLWKKNQHSSEELILERFVFTYADTDQYVSENSAIPSFAIADKWNATPLPGGHSDVLDLIKGENSTTYKFVRDKIWETLFSSNTIRYFPSENMGLQAKPLGLSTEQAIFSHLLYSSRSSPFIGRKEEIKKLTDFCADSRNFYWWVVTGEMGMGKSRLALEHALLMKEREHWNWMFLGAGQVLERNLTTLARGIKPPCKPTLLIIDDASFYGHDITAAIQNCAQLSNSWKFKVRILILDRSISGGWYEQLTATMIEEDSAQIRNSRYQMPMKLDELPDADISQMFNNMNLNSEAKYKLLKELNLDRRPLYALLLIHFHDELNIRDGNDIITGYLQREYVRWIAVGLTKQDKVLLRIATVCDNIDLNSLSLPSEISKLLTLVKYAEDTDGFKRRWAGITREESSRLYGLKPHLLGDFFVLDSVQLPENNFMKSLASTQWRTEFATYWNYNTREFLDFSIRILQEYPKHQKLLLWLQTVLATCPETKESKQLLAEFLMSTSYYLIMAGKLELAHMQYDEIVNIAIAYPGNAKIAMEQARTAVTLTNSYADVINLETVHRLYAEITVLATKYRGNAGIILEQVRVAVNLLKGYCIARKSELAHKLYDEITYIANAHHGNSEFALMRVKAAFNLAKAYGIAGESELAHILYGEISFTVDTHPGIAEIALEQAKTAVNLTLDYDPTKDFVKICKLYEQIATIASTYPDNIEIAQMKSRVIVNLMKYYGDIGELAHARKLNDEITAIVNAFPDNAEIALQKAKSIFNMITFYCLTGELKQSDELYTEILAVNNGYPANAEIALERVKAAANLTEYYGIAKKLDQAYNLYAEISSIVNIYPGNVEIALGQVKAAVNLTKHHVGELEEIRKVYDEISDIADAYPGKFDFALMQSIIASNLIKYYPPEALEQIYKLYNKIASIARSYSNNFKLELEQVKAAGYLIMQHPIGELENIRKLYDEVAAISCTYPDNVEISHEQAAAALNLSLYYNTPEEWKYAHKLYEDIVGIASAHSNVVEIALCRAVAAYNLTTKYGPAGELEENYRLYYEIAHICKSFPSNDTIALMQAKAAFHLTKGYDIIENFDQIIKLYGEIKVVAKTYANNAEIALEQAKIACILIDNYSKKNELKYARDLYNETLAIIKTYPNNVEIAIRYSRAVNILTLMLVGANHIREAWQIYGHFLNIVKTFRDNSEIALLYTTIAKSLPML